MNTTLDQIRPLEERLLRCLPRLAPHWERGKTLSSLALDSLDIVEMLCAIHEEFGLRLAESDLPPSQTLGGLIEVIARKKTR